ncbi:TolC family protein [Desulfotomaculum sp. 1211_IL3151]|uniref:TolC family protein n=1 Tax=Desulfotomaculum sp. 1211_IL3151 TaxID=3084055 RepID=UPI002FDB5711
MGKMRILLLAMFFVLGSASLCFADTEAVSQTEVITLEQAKGLVKENSRSLKKYEINADRTKYQQQQANYQYYEAIDKYNGEDYERIKSASSNIQNAENNYHDAVQDEENYRKQMDYIVEEIYTSLLNQEDSLNSLHKEQELKQYQLGLERKKLTLGSSSQYKVDELAASVTTLKTKVMDQTNSIKTKKGQFNDLLGRDYDAELQLVPFETSQKVELPEYTTLLSDVSSAYSTLSRLQRDLRDMEDDLDDEDDFDYYKYLVLRQEIKAKELELVDEKNSLNEVVNNLLTDVTSKQQDYQVALTNYTNAQRSYEWAQKRYEMGQLSKLALLESELNYLNVKNQKVTAGYSFYLSQHSLKLAAEGIVMN